MYIDDLHSWDTGELLSFTADWILIERHEAFLYNKRASLRGFGKRHSS